MTDTEKFSLGNVAWGFPAASLHHAKAETSQPTPIEQLRAIAQAETAFNTCGKMDRMVIHGQLVAAQSNADFPAILAHVEAMEAEREVNYQLGFAQRRVEILTGELAAMRLRAEKAEAIVALAAAVERGFEACNRMKNECQTDGWTGPKLLALEEARQVYMVATDALQAALPKAGEP